MLRAAINYKDEINRKLAEKVLRGDTLELTQAGYSNLGINLVDSTWEAYQFASVLNSQAVGFIQFSSAHPGNRINEVILIAFSVADTELMTFGIDCKRAFEKMFDTFKVDNIYFSCLSGTHSETHYDRLTQQLGGRRVGIIKNGAVDGSYILRDKVLYQIMAKDYYASVKANAAIVKLEI
jgi:hypothetical protein